MNPCVTQSSNSVTHPAFLCQHYWISSSLSQKQVPLAVIWSLFLLSCPPPICNPHPLILSIILCCHGDLFLFPPRLASPTCFKFQSLQIPCIQWDSLSISLTRLALSNTVAPSNMGLFKTFF